MKWQSDKALTSSGHVLDTSPRNFGALRDSSPVAHQGAELRARMEEDGYLYLPGILDRAQVLAARRRILEQLESEGALAAGTPLMEGVLRDGYRSDLRPDLAAPDSPLFQVLYRGRMLEFYERLLGGTIRHFDYTWLRPVVPGHGTQPHCDIVFMGRGTPNLYTAWTPLGDVSLELGGLIVLENSHRNERLKNSYGRKDVDKFCVNRVGKNYTGMGGGGNIRTGGALTNDPVTLRERLGGRWLTAEFRAGDLLTFSMNTVHASLDNSSQNRLRLSCDSRYQLASEPADERWIGAQPFGHGPQAKREMIC